LESHDVRNVTAFVITGGKQMLSWLHCNKIETKLMKWKVDGI